MITRDNGVAALALVAAQGPAYSQRIFPYRLRRLETCRPKDVPQHAEKILPAAVGVGNLQAFLKVLDQRMTDLSSAQTARVKKVIREASKRISGKGDAAMPDKVDQATQNMMRNLEQNTGKSLAQWVTLARASGGEADLVAAQYAGEKSGLRPIYDALIKAVGKFGPDVEVSPQKTYVSLRRSKQFALIQPCTKERVAVGIGLKGVKPHGRLEAAGSFNAMVSRRVRVAAIKEVDRELVAWLKSAYEAA